MMEEEKKPTKKLKELLTIAKRESVHFLWKANKEGTMQAAMANHFLLNKHSHIKSLDNASKYYLSLACFIEELHYLDGSMTYYACRFLRYLIPAYWNEFSPDDILYELVPVHDGSCSGFAESIVILLTSSNEDLVKAALELLDGLVCSADPANHFDLLATGLFDSLPESLYEEYMNYLQAPNKSLMNIVTMTFIDYFLEPIKPFLEIIFTFRRQFEGENEALIFSNFLAATVEFSLIQEQKTQPVLSSSSFALAYTDSLALFDASKINSTLLHGASDCVRPSWEEYPAVLKRGRRVFAKLREEGFSDEIELFLLAYRPSTNPFLNINPFLFGKNLIVLG
ncbi:hypothetical protein BLNAU_9854 [Blattamonas nauphoetae]|uniref:Uncharacterized protein n=1 Tax=Blattamonas nauphoetae TaxID=2049346 RepID=A0ABQ9XUH0_9EUKA|nr:hypothetical protein BLNAU_9854 [Blattamonas nauphoetae]